MKDAPLDLQEQVRSSYARVAPTRYFRGCKFEPRDGYVIVRIYSHAHPHERLLPVPYAIFRFDVAGGALTAPSKEEIEEFTIRNYK